MRVLDPACGTGNFLYVTLELMKRLEGEVLDTLAGYARGDAGLLDLAGATVNPEQFFGLDVNPRAVPVAELVLWIGYLQWHFRTNGAAPPAEPILRDFRTIREADALLSYARTEADRDGAGRPVTRWGGRTAPHPITGEQVPDLADQVLVLRPVGGKPAPWPAADFIVGNPPFVAGKDLRAELGGGYAEALWAAYPKVPPSADMAMFFWWRAAEAVRAGGQGPAFWLHYQQQHLPSVQSPHHRRGDGGGKAAAPGLRHPRSPVGTGDRNSSSADRNDGGCASSRSRPTSESRAGGHGSGTGRSAYNPGRRSERRPDDRSKPGRGPTLARQRAD